MNIISKSANLTAADIFSMTKSNTIRKMQDAKGEVLNVAKYVLYTDENQNGEEQKVLAIETDKGVRYATNSKTFIRNFSDIMTIFQESGEAAPVCFLVGSGVSRNDREYLTCDIGYSA